MKKPTDYKKNDKVIIVNEIELEQLLDYYNEINTNTNIITTTSNNNKLTKKDIKELANHIVTIIWVPNKNELNSWDGRIIIKNELNKIYSIPFAAIIELNEGIVEESDDNNMNNSNNSNNIFVVRDKDSENNLVKQLAAETIQSTYRRYRECKPAIKLKRVSSEERLVMEMAADTIKQGLRTIVKGKKRSKHPQNGRPPLPYDLDQPYSMSNMSSNSSQYSIHSNDNGYFDQTPRINSPKSLITPELRSHTPPNFSNKQSLITITIKLITAIKLKCVKWNGKNDPYIVLSLGNKWKYETEVIWNALEPAKWNVNIEVVVNNKEINEMKFEVYSANLVREDQLIGIGTFSLDELNINSFQEITVNLTNDNNSTKIPVPSGMLVLNLSNNETKDISKYQFENIYERNKHHQDKDDIYQQSKDYKNETKTNTNLKTKLSPSKLKNQSNKNNKFENNQLIAEEKNNNINNSDDNNSSKKVRISESEKKVKIDSNIKGDKKVQKAEEKKKSNSLNNNNSNTNNNDSDNDLKDITPNQPPPKPIRPTSAPSKRVESSTGEKLKSKYNEYKSNERISAWEENDDNNNKNNNNNKVQNRAAEKNKFYDDGLSNTIPSKPQNKISVNESSDEEIKPRKNKDKKKSKLKFNNGIEKSLIENFISFDINEVDISPDSHRRIVDQALETAFLEECSSIILHHQEIALLLDALNIPLIEGVLHPSTSYRMDVESSQYSVVSKSTKSTLVLSLQNPALMAASLSEYCREKNLIDLQKYNIKQFSISQSQSITAIKQLILLIYGPWKKVRKIILTAADTNVSFGGGRPSYWTSKWIEKIINLLKFPSNKFDDYNGEDFIFLDEQHIGHLLKSSILRSRCRLYVKILHLLDTWWDKGIRPKDITKEFVSKLNETSESISPTNKKKNKLKQIQFSDGDIVKIISSSPSSNKLLESYLPIQRAYGWKTTPEDLTILTELVNGCIGIISKRTTYGTNRLEINGMYWVEFREENLTLMSKDNIFNMLRDYDGKIEPVSGRCVLIPISCLQHYTPPPISSLTLASSSISSNSKKQPQIQLLSSIPIENITNGMSIRVQPLEILSRAYERYDWWDRPTVSVLQNISGKLGTIVSCTSTAETKRVGVSIKGPDSVEIIDALPLEALIFLPTDKDNNNNDNDEKKIEDKNLNKSKKGHENNNNIKSKKVIVNKPSQTINENIVEKNETSIKQSKEAWNKERNSNTNNNNNNNSTKYKTQPKSSGNVFFGNIENPQINNNNNNNNNNNFGDNDENISSPFIGGGDESVPDDDIDLRNVMMKDLRIYEVPKPISSVQLNSSTRPLYRPMTAKNLTTPNSIDSPNEESNIEPPKYNWMSRSLQPDPRINLSLEKDVQTLPIGSSNTQNPQNIIKPKLSTTTLEIDPSIQRSYGLHDGKTQAERNLNDLTSKITKSKSKSATNREIQSKKQQNNNGDSNDRKTVSISEFDFVIGGTSLGGGLDLQRPKTSSSSSNNINGNNNNINNNNNNTNRTKPNSRPSSAGTTRRPTTANNPSSLSSSLLNKTKDMIKTSKEAEDIEKIKYDERMKRDLKRTEKDIKIKEASLKRQLKKYGVNPDEYDSYHQV